MALRLALVVLIPLSAEAYSVSNGLLVEDFSTLEKADLANSTGFWNVASGAVEAKRCASNTIIPACAPLDFGDGHDGVLESTNGYTFNTDTHPDGYSFVSVNITGGTITVTGSNPLVIRSLKNVNIVPAIRVNGGNGANGSNDNAATEQATPGGVAVASKATGGTGGAATAGTQTAGGNARDYDGTINPGTGGAAGGGNGLVGASFPSNADFFEDATSDFYGGSSSGGGGGRLNGNYASGGGGGAGGGMIRVVAAGNISLGAPIEAKGGNGGNGGKDGVPNACAGDGAGGHGGVVWLQALGSISSPSPPDISGGNGGDNGCNAAGVAGNPGVYRGDSASGSPAGWSNGFATMDVLAAQSYSVQSRVYDLGTVNAVFNETPTVVMTSNGGALDIAYSGSADGIIFTPFNPDIRALNHRNIRYLRFKVTLTTAGAAGPSPKVSKITIPYAESEFHLSGGCGIGSTQTKDQDGPWSTVFWSLLWITGYLAICRYRLVLNARGVDS